jgi:hypothetical protein
MTTAFAHLKTSLHALHVTTRAHHAGRLFGGEEGVVTAEYGLLLALIPDSVYDFYDGHWGLTALEDQQIGGVTMSTEAAIVFFAVFAFYFARVVREN